MKSMYTMVSEKVIQMLKEHIDADGCSNCDGKWCSAHATREERTAYAAKYGCICDICCHLCKNAEGCGISSDPDYHMDCKDCDLRCGLNPRYSK